jgi:DNA-directed RNA polymerase subunit RPC12/RpoP
MKKITIDGIYTGSEQGDCWNRLCGFHHSWKCSNCGNQNEEMIKATNNLNDTEIENMEGVNIMEDNYGQVVLTLDKGIYCMYCSSGWDIKNIKLNFPNTNAHNSCLKNKEDDMRFMLETMYDY